MFGFQRIGDLIWAAADMRTRGFLIGGTAGRTTLAGEGLQHQDGHSHVLALSVPNLLAYDPAFAYEIAVIIQDGIKRMYVDQESIFYYLTVTNEPLAMPEMPQGDGVRDGILKGLYRFKASEKKESKLRAQLFGSGTIMYEVLKAQQILEEKYGVAGGRLERDQLQVALSRCQRLRALEHAASRRDSAHTLRDELSERYSRRAGRGIRLYEGAAGVDCEVVAASADGAGDGWLWTQRESCSIARLL
jgi:pyruvate dehydrogenase complex dehydrogenase (E1) component